MVVDAVHGQARLPGGPRGGRAPGEQRQNADLGRAGRRLGRLPHDRALAEHADHDQQRGARLDGVTDRVRGQLALAPHPVGRLPAHRDRIARATAQPQGLGDPLDLPGLLRPERVQGPAPPQPARRGALLRRHRRIGQDDRPVHITDRDRHGDAVEQRHGPVAPPRPPRPSPPPGLLPSRCRRGKRDPAPGTTESCSEAVRARRVRRSSWEGRTSVPRKAVVAPCPPPRRTRDPHTPSTAYRSSTQRPTPEQLTALAAANPCPPERTALAALVDDPRSAARWTGRPCSISSPRCGPATTRCRPHPRPTPATPT